MRRGISVLEQLDYKLVENERDIDFIEEWYQLGLSTRKILKINLEEFLEMEITGEVENFLKTYKKIFIKSETKGFCAIVHGEKILQKDAKLVGFLKEKCNLYGNKLLMTNFFEIKEDSLGKRESRHVVLNGKLINSSRRIHSLKHCVPKSHLDKAKEIINKVSKIENYPQNYVLDIGDFVINGEVVVDIVELNPISCSMCYVNNSVFEKELPEIEFIKKKLMIGNEYCYDALKNPNYYFEIRKSNKCYSYITEEMYELL